jgi:hypothetical protein
VFFWSLAPRLVLLAHLLEQRQNCQCERVKETANFRTSFPEVLFRGVDRLLVHARTSDKG